MNETTDTENITPEKTVLYLSTKTTNIDMEQHEAVFHKKEWSNHKRRKKQF